MKTLVLDFDGVIADSQYETLVVGFNTYLSLNKGTKLFGGQRINFNNFNKVKKKYKSTVDQFKKLRPFGIDNFCPYVLLTAIENKIRIKSQNEHIKLRNKMLPGSYKKNLKHFLKERAELQKMDFNKWVQMDMPFKSIINAVRKLQKRCTIAVATMNRKKSIIRLLKKYKIRPKIIADPTISPDKKKQLEHIKNKLWVKFNDMHFVDDQVKHFPRLLKLGVHCYLATWGYNTKEQQKEARRLGAVLLSQNNFYSILSKQ